MPASPQSADDPVSGLRSPVSGLDISGFVQRLLWLCLPACASMLLLAVTNKMCQDVAPTPFLWVLPLGLYLLSFIIAFDSPRWYSRFYYTLALVVAAVAVCHALFEGADLAIVGQIIIYSGALFIGCMICHGEVYRLKPHPQQLTAFYLMIAAGGAVGGLFVALVAPVIFNNYYEIHLSIALIAASLLVISWLGKSALTPRRWQVLGLLLALAAIYGADRGFARAVSWFRHREAFRELPLFQSATWWQIERMHWLVWILAAMAGFAGWRILRRRNRPLDGHALTCWLMGAGVVVLVLALTLQIRDAARGSLLSARNFYGVLSVYEYEKERPEAHYYLLLHGRITHGLQFVSPGRAREITSYFGPASGLGLALKNFPRQQNQRVGLLGLGVGTVTAYGKKGDTYRVYEINPQVKDLAEKPFSYVAGSDATVEIVMGDARLSMENEPPQNFDILIMDAFSSDAVPVHLLTKEAFEIYQRHLKPDGVILVNISNRYLDLRPVVENAARAFAYQSIHIVSEDGAGEEDEGSSWWLYGSSWMILSKNSEFMNRAPLRYAASPASTKPNKIPLWTDDYASMFMILQ